MDEGVWWFMGILFFGGVVLTGLYALSSRKARRRRRIAIQGITHEQREHLKKYNLYQRMPEHLQHDLESKIAVFLAEKHFEPCGGMHEVTEEARVLIAASACTLLINKPSDFFPKLDTILLYPSAYYAAQPDHIGEGIFEEDHQLRAGESWTFGPLVLSWADAHADCVSLHPTHNVVIHEFTHQLDQLDGVADGAPVLPFQELMVWRRTFSRGLDNLRRAIRHHAEAVIDEYGATNPAEFFAVTTESFFCTPRALRIKHPQLYAELAQYFHLDPAEWPGHCECDCELWHGDQCDHECCGF